MILLTLISYIIVLGSDAKGLALFLDADENKETHQAKEASVAFEYKLNW
jgi:hypothetical protein